MEARVIQLEDVSVVYPGDVRALRPTSLGFEPGRFTVLLGPSGAGKSTLLRCLNGLVRPSAGRVLGAQDGDISDRRALRRHRRRTAMVFQQHQLIGRLSALRNVTTGRLAFHATWRTLFALPKDDRRISLACLERVGLLQDALRRVDNLSGGQQQRVGIARALAQRPSLILADEPVASLDPGTAQRVLALLHEICRSDGISAIVSLHQVQLATEFADRIVGIAEGAVVFDGPKQSLTDRHLEEIYGRPASRPDLAVPDRRPAAAAPLALAME